MLAAAVDLESDIMDFCLNQLEVETVVIDEMNVDVDKFLVSLHHFTKVKRLTYRFWIWPQIYNSKTDDDVKQQSMMRI